jgi:hypothetical protein
MIVGFKIQSDTAHTYIIVLIIQIPPHNIRGGSVLLDLADRITDQFEDANGVLVRQFGELDPPGEPIHFIAVAAWYGLGTMLILTISSF